MIPMPEQWPDNGAPAAPVLADSNQKGIAKALSRDAEFDANPESGISLEQLDQRIAAHRSE